jgi:phosphofructokinase-like protein
MSGGTIPHGVIKRIGICTCGGDCPGLNPVIRAAVRTAILKYGWTVLGIEDSTAGLIDLNYHGPKGNMELTLATVDEIISKGGTILGSSNKSHPFKYAVQQEDGKYVETDVSDLVIENFKKLGLDALIMIGGDGSMEIGYKLLKKGLPLVGVPKTIDNDLLATDVTFGFDTATQTIVEAIDKIRDTALSHDRVIVVEVMGRNVGWLALHSGIAAAADVILIPEIPYDTLLVLKKVRERRDSGYFSSIVVVSEGTKPKGGSESVVGERKAGEMIRFAGAADRLAKDMERLNARDSPYYIHNFEVRTSVLGYIQRGGSPSNFDRLLGTRLGVKAADMVAEKQFGKMACVSGQSIQMIDLQEVTKGQKFVDPQGDVVNMAKTIGICFGD